MGTLSREEWIARCIRRIGEVDGGIPENEARDIACQLQEFERTCAMEPEAAVDFVANEISSGRPGRFERRLVPRG